MSKLPALTGPIVWAIDPFETKAAPRAPLAKFLKTFSRAIAQDVLPFSVISPEGGAWPVPVEYDYGRRLQRFGSANVSKTLRKLRMTSASPTVEVHESSSRRELVGDVLRFSKDHSAGFLAVNTQRLLAAFPRKVGGFAEALIGKSSLPVIAVSPQAKVKETIREILFPTDFSPASRRAFLRTVALARRLGARVTLWHRDETFLAAWMGATDIPIPQDEGLIVELEARELRHTQRTAARWCAYAEHAGVHCVYRPSRRSGSVAKAILAAAKETRCDLIVLPSYRRSSTPALMGGTAREVLSHARVPVMEIRAV